MQNIAFDFESFYLYFLCQKPHFARQSNGSDEAKAFQENGSEIMLQQLKLVPFRSDTNMLCQYVDDNWKMES